MRKSDSPSNTDEGLSASRRELRERIIKTAIRLLKKGGRDALTTRAVAEAAGVQPPTLYRFFGDKRGLLDAVAEHGLSISFSKKIGVSPSADPVDDLRKIWDLHIAFGLENPVIYSLMVGDPHPGAFTPAAQKSRTLLMDLIHRIAALGRLRVSEQRAAELVYAVSTGIVLSLLRMPKERRDLSLVKEGCEIVIAAITHSQPIQKKRDPKTAAITLQALLPDVKSLTDAERQQFSEWLTKIATDP